MAKLKVWLDSGVNIHSTHYQIIDLDELGFTLEEWNELPEAVQENMAREIAFNYADWGFQIINTEGDEHE
jgi:hypothetical protein